MKKQRLQAKNFQKNQEPIVVVLDTTYWKRTLGLMVFKKANSEKVLYWQYVDHETVALYLDGLDEIKRMGYDIKSVVCDGRLLRALPIPTQMCQFHQMAIITRYLTKNPKLDASIELKEIVEKLPAIKRKLFEKYLNNWFLKWDLFLKEKTLNEKTGQWSFRHRRLRSACRSLKRNIDYLFVYQNFPDLRIPNTTNEIEGLFTYLKTRCRIHSGMNLLHKKKFLDYLLNQKI